MPNHSKNHTKESLNTCNQNSDGHIQSSMGGSIWHSKHSTDNESSTEFQNHEEMFGSNELLEEDSSTLINSPDSSSTGSLQSPLLSTIQPIKAGITSLDGSRKRTCSCKEFFEYSQFFLAASSQISSLSAPPSSYPLNIERMFETFHQSPHGDFKPTFYNPFEIKHRRRTTKSQFKTLEMSFQENPKPNATVRRTLASKLGMTPRAVQVWFQNRRAKVKSTQSNCNHTGDEQDNYNSFAEGHNNCDFNNESFETQGSQKPLCEPSSKPLAKGNIVQVEAHQELSLPTALPIFTRGEGSTILGHNCTKKPSSHATITSSIISRRHSMPNMDISIDANSMEVQLPFRQLHEAIFGSNQSNMQPQVPNQNYSQTASNIRRMTVMPQQQISSKSLNYSNSNGAMNSMISPTGYISILGNGHESGQRDQSFCHGIASADYSHQATPMPSAFPHQQQATIYQQPQFPHIFYSNALNYQPQQQQQLFLGQGSYQNNLQQHGNAGKSSIEQAYDPMIGNCPNEPSSGNVDSHVIALGQNSNSDTTANHADLDLFLQSFIMPPPPPATNSTETCRQMLGSSHGKASSPPPPSSINPQQLYGSYTGIFANGGSSVGSGYLNSKVANDDLQLRHSSMQGQYISDTLATMLYGPSGSSMLAGMHGPPSTAASIGRKGARLANPSDCSTNNTHSDCGGELMLLMDHREHLNGGISHENDISSGNISSATSNQSSVYLLGPSFAVDDSRYIQARGE